MTNLIPTVALVDGTPRVSSLDIAERFGKAHDQVLKVIRKITADCPEKFTAVNFDASEYTDSTGRKLPAYSLTRDAFSLVAMGFTGKEALAWKVRYIEAFNAMETELVKQAKKALPVKAKKPAQKALPAAKQKTLLAPKLTIEEDIQLFAEEVKQAHAQVYAFQKQICAFQKQIEDTITTRAAKIMSTLAARMGNKVRPSENGRVCVLAMELLPYVLKECRSALRDSSEHLLSYENPARLLMSYAKLERDW